MASLIARAANVAANDRFRMITISGELTTYRRTPFANTPYNVKMTNVITINTILRENISNIGDVEFGKTKSGRNAKKNIDSLGLRIFIKKALFAICHKPF
jgi:hypothetical protein